MPILTLSADDPQAPARAAEAAARIPPGAPVLAMVHGFRYAPGSRRTCPTRRLYAPEGWPGALRFDPLRDDSGLAIGFGWDARGSIWTARRAAARAAGALAGIATAVRLARRGPLDVLGHSLGARVALGAAALAPEGSFGRLILLAAAAFRGEAQAALATPGGQSAEVFNITSRENDLFDLALETCIRRRRGPALGAGLGEIRRNWVDIEIDNAEVLAALALLGFAVPPSRRAISHWSGYTRPGLPAFYAALLRHRDELPLALIAALLPDHPRPRFARLPGPGPLPGLAQRLRPPFAGRRAT